MTYVLIILYLQRKSEDYYPMSPADTFISGRFQIKIISLKYHVDYEVRVLDHEMAQVRSNEGRPIHIILHFIIIFRVGCTIESISR